MNEDLVPFPESFPTDSSLKLLRDAFLNRSVDIRQAGIVAWNIVGFVGNQYLPASVIGVVADTPSPAMDGGPPDMSEAAIDAAIAKVAEFRTTAVDGVRHGLDFSLFLPLLLRMAEEVLRRLLSRPVPA